MNFYRPKYFSLQELLPEDFYYENKHRGNYLWVICFDPRILWTADRLRKRYGKMIANTWHWGNVKKHQFRGFRPPDCEIGSIFSQHRFGRGLDLVPAETSADSIRDDILSNPYDREDFQYITCIEEDISWLHIDNRNWDKAKQGILIVKP